MVLNRLCLLLATLAGIVLLIGMGCSGTRALAFEPIDRVGPLCLDAVLVAVMDPPASLLDAYNMQQLCRCEDVQRAADDAPEGPARDLWSGVSIIVCTPPPK